jgi:hypothetical protein
LATDDRRAHPVIRCGSGAVTEQSDDWLGTIANGYGIAFAPPNRRRAVTAAPALRTILSRE